MNRVAVFIAFTSLLGTPALAATYSAKPAAAPSAATIMGKSIAWTCAGGTCRGSTEASRPVVLCQDLAKRAGRIESFITNGQELPADQLAKCNSSAKDGAPAELAKVN